MDWAPTVNPCITEDDLGGFRYDKPRSEESSVPTVLRYQGNKFEIIHLDGEGAWKKWLQDDIFKDRHLDASHPRSNLSGFQLLVSPDIEPLPALDFSRDSYARVNRNPDLDGDSLDDEIKPQPLPQPHNNLPFSRSNWRTVIKAFMTPKAILHPTKRNKCQSTFVACNHGGTDLELYTAVAAPYNRLGSFSLSCAYFCAPKLTLAVLYSCDSTQLRRITQLLQGSPDVASHPLLMVGVFAELQLNRMEELVGRVHQLCDYNTRVYTVNWGINGAASIKTLNRLLRDATIKAKEAEEEMRAARAQLKEIADRIDHQETAWGAWAPPLGVADSASLNTTAISNRFKGRFKEIDNEIDGLMSQCRTAAEVQQYTGDLFMSESSRQEARASRRQGMQSKFLAMIATIFLPMTSVATIFAVPAFKFDNNWLDIRFKPANSSENHGGSLSSPSNPPDSVFSGYGIIFIVVSVCLSCFTYYAYLSATSRLEENDDLRLEDPTQRHRSAAAGQRPGARADWQGKEGSGSSSSSSSLPRLKSCRMWPWFSGRGRMKQRNDNPGDSLV